MNKTYAGVGVVQFYATPTPTPDKTARHHDTDTDTDTDTPALQIYSEHLLQQRFFLNTSLPKNMLLYTNFRLLAVTFDKPLPGERHPIYVAGFISK